jgi:hypothetical protein
VRDELAGLVAAIKGIHYELADIWDIIERVSADDASFFASVPHYTDGYRRMFRTPNLAWNEPQVAQFDPKRFVELTRRLGEAKCAALLCPARRLAGRNPYALEARLRPSGKPREGALDHR